MASTLRLTYLIGGDPLSVILTKISGDDPPVVATACTHSDGIYTADFDDEGVGIEGTYVCRFHDGDDLLRYLGYVRLIDGETSDVMDTLKATEDPVVAPAVNLDDLSSSVALRISRASVKSESIPKSTIVVARGTTWRIPIGIIPESWSSIEVTCRKKSRKLQSESLFYVKVTNPESESDGLQVFAGSAEVDADDGSVSISEVDRAATCLVQATSNADAEIGEYCFDSKLTTEEGIDQITHGDFIVDCDVTRTQ